MIDTHIAVSGIVAVGSSAAAVVVAAIDPTLIAGAAVLVIAAIAGAAVQVINAVGVMRREAAATTAALLKVAEESAAKNDEILVKASKIENTTNGTNTHLQTMVTVLNEKVAGMDRIIAQMKEEKETTAAMRVLTDAQKAPTAEPEEVIIVNPPHEPVSVTKPKP